MSRVQKNQAVQQEVEAMKKDVVQVAATAGRRRWITRIGCCLAPVVVLGVLALYIAWLVAASGIATIPLFTSMAYEKPEPFHVVMPGEKLEDVIATELETEVTARLRRGGGTIQDRAIAINLPQDAFTATVRNLLTESQITTFDTEKVQVAVVENRGIEVFLPFADNAQESAFVVELEIMPDNGLLGFDAKRARVGALNLPEWTVDLFVEPAVANSFSSFNRELGRFARIEEVRFSSGNVIFEGEITVEVLELESL